MQVTVMYGIMLALLNKQTVSRAYLADKFEISERTVSRYLDALDESGVPLVRTKGRGGGYSISDGYMLDRYFFTEEELQHLLTSVKATEPLNPNSQTELTAKLKRLFKNKKASPDTLIRNDTLVIDAGTWNNPSQYRSRMEPINLAINAGKTISLTYVDRHDLVSDRMVDPYALALKEGIWYLYGWCHKRESFRLFKLSRIRELIVTERKFERKRSDVYAAMRGSFEQDTMVRVKFEFTSLIYDDIRDCLGPDAIEEQGLQYVATADLYNGPVLLQKLLSFGSSIRIIYPTSLKNELYEEWIRCLKNTVRNGDKTVERIKRDLSK